MKSDLGLSLKEKVNPKLLEPDAILPKTQEREWV